MGSQWFDFMWVVIPAQIYFCFWVPYPERGAGGFKRLSEVVSERYSAFLCFPLFSWSSNIRTTFKKRQGSVSSIQKVDIPLRDCKKTFLKGGVHWIVSQHYLPLETETRVGQQTSLSPPIPPMLCYLAYLMTGFHDCLLWIFHWQRSTYRIDFVCSDAVCYAHVKDIFYTFTK